MKKMNILLTLLATIVSAGCEQEFKIVDTDGENRIYIEFLPSTLSDWHELTVIGAKSINNGAQNDISSYDIKVRLTADGEEVTLEKDNTYRATYMAYHHFEPGQTISIEAEAKGYSKAYAQCIIPEPVKEFSTKVEKGEDYPDEIKVTIEYPDNPETKDMYGAVMVQEEWNEAQMTGFIDAVNLQMSYNVFDESAYRTMTLRGKKIAYWNDAQITENGRQKITLSFSGVKNGPDVTYRFKVLMLKTSADFYRYFDGQWDKESNILASMGLASPTFTFTNITDGLGILGSLSHTESEWMENPL